MVFPPDDAFLTVGMVIFPRLTQLDLTGPYEVFARMPRTKIHLMAQTLEPVRSDRGLTIVPDMRFEDAPQPDVLFVPGGHGVNPLMEDQPFLDFLRKQGKQARYVTSVCTGSLLLAAAGLLDGYKATTHWQSLDLLGMLGAEVVKERVVIDRNRITGGGVTSGIDFALVVASELFGPKAAQAIQLTIEYNPAPPFEGGTPEKADPAVLDLVNERGRETQAARLEIVRRVVSQREKQ